MGYEFIIVSEQATNKIKNMNDYNNYHMLT